MEKSLQHLYKLPFKNTKLTPSLQASPKRIYPSKILQSPSNFNSLRSYSLSKENRLNRLKSKNLRKLIIKDFREDNLTPELRIKKSDLYIDTSPSPKIQLQVRLPSLVSHLEIEDSIELFKNRKKRMTPNGILIESDETYQNDQGTQTESLLDSKLSILSNKNSLKRQGKVLKGRDIDQLVQNFRISSLPEPNLPNEFKFFRKLKKVSTYKDT